MKYLCLCLCLVLLNAKLTFAPAMPLWICALPLLWPALLNVLGIVLIAALLTGRYTIK